MEKVEEQKEKREKVKFHWDEDGEEKKKGISETLKKILVTGLSSPFLSEEQLNAYLSSLNLPKDMVAQILSGLVKSKDEITGKLASEFSKLVQKVDLVKELKNILVENKISINASIEFIPRKTDEKKKTTRKKTEKR